MIVASQTYGRCHSGRSPVVRVDTSGLALSTFASLYCVIAYVIYHMYYISYMHQASYILCISNVPPPPCFSSSTWRADWGCCHAGHARRAGHNGSTWYVGVFMIKFCRLKKWALVHNGVFILQQVRTRHLKIKHMISLREVISTSPFRSSRRRSPCTLVPCGSWSSWRPRRT